MKKIVLTLVFVSLAVPALAQSVGVLETNAKQAYLMDTTTGTPLFEKNADEHMPTSSMSKMMTIYMVFEALKNGKLKMEDELPTSEYAWKQEGSRMFLNAGQTAKVEDLIRGVVVQSGNDASVVFAEALGSGSEAAFADMMNIKAKELGMNNSHFMNSTGLPHKDHYSTARDLAILAVALLRDFPEHYHYFSETEFTYNKIKQGNRNPLLYRNMNVDGLKTGHTEDGGYGLVASASRDGRRLVMVLNAMRDMQARADESAHVLDWGYREFGLYSVAKAGDKLADAQVWLGVQPTVDVVAGKDAVLTLPRTARAGLKTAVAFDQPVPAPITKGQQIGKLTITAPGMEEKTVPLVAGADVPQVGFFARITAKIQMLFRKV